MVLFCGMLSLACTHNLPPEAPPDTPPLLLTVLDNVPEPPPPPPLVIEPEEELVTRSLEELNQDSPLQPVFFAYDSAEIDAPDRRVLDQNAEILRRNPNKGAVRHSRGSCLATARAGTPRGKLSRPIANHACRRGRTKEAAPSTAGSSPRPSPPARR